MESTANLQKIIDWLSPRDSLQKADLIFVFGSNTLKTPQKAAELFQAGLAPQILLSGNTGTFGNREWKDPSAQIFKTELLRLKIPESAIIVQPDSTNTLEDVTLSIDIISKYVNPGGNIIIVSKPLHQLRAYLTIKKQLPQYNYTNQPCDFDPDLDTKEVISTRCTQEIERIQKYAEKGDIVKIELPEFINSL